MAKNTLTINGTDISTYGIYISSDTYLDAPKIDYAEYQIPAKNGTAILDRKRLNNVIRKFDCYIPEGQNIETAINQLKSLLYLHTGYMSLVSSYDSTWYQYGYLAQEINVKPFKKNGSAEFTLYFSCLPEHHETTSTAYQSTNNIGVSGYGTWFRSNNDSELLEFQTKLNNDYPYSQIGWIYGGYTSSPTLTEGNTYTVNVSSTDTQRYVVLLAKVQSGSPATYTYDIIREVSDYNADNVTFTVPVEGYTWYFITYAVPVFFNDINIEATWSGNTAKLKATMTGVTSTHFTNTGCIGISPVFVYKKLINYSHISDGVVPYDLFAFNDQKYLVDFISLANDMTRQFLYDNYVVSGSIYVYLDFINKKAYLLDSLAMNGNKLVDISAYFKCYGESMMGDTFAVKYGAIYEIDPNGITNYFIQYGIDGKITFQTNWCRI